MEICVVAEKAAADALGRDENVVAAVEVWKNIFVTHFSWILLVLLVVLLLQIMWSDRVVFHC